MNAATFNALYAKHYRTLWLQAAAWGVPWDECADVAHETFLRVWESGQEPEGDGAGWLWTIAYRILVDQHRARLRQGERVGLCIALNTQGQEDNPDDRLEVDRLLAGLDPRDRAVVELLSHGYTGDQAGAALGGVTKATVYRRYHYALAVMRGADLRSLTHAGKPISRGNIVKGLR